MRWYWWLLIVLGFLVVCFGGNLNVALVLLKLYSGWLGLILLAVGSVYLFLKTRR